MLAVLSAEIRISKSGIFAVADVSWYDALVYCNKRSVAEGLTPVVTQTQVNGE